MATTGPKPTKKSDSHFLVHVIANRYDRKVIKLEKKIKEIEERVKKFKDDANKLRESAKYIP